MIRRVCLLLCFLSLFVSSFVEAADKKYLFVGNSYTFGNQPHSLQEITETLLELNIPAWKDVFTEQIAYGGYRWEQHAKDADGTNGDKALRERLVVSTDPNHMWDIVFFQEQSQIPGFPSTSPYWTASLQSLKIMHQFVARKGAKTMLLMTWGRREGDPQNRTLFPDFKGMQSRLTQGYTQFAKQASTTAAPVWIAPAGLAWEAIFDDLRSKGQVPAQQGTVFWGLYEGDGSHPSQQGSYLAGCAIFSSITGRSTEGTSWDPNNALGASERTYLQKMASQAVLQQAFILPYPWTFAWKDYVGPTDVSHTGKVISGLNIWPYVRVAQTLPKMASMWIGAPHTGGAGGGRLRLVAGASMEVDALVVGKDATGSLDVRGGTLKVKTLTLADGTNASGSVLLRAGTVEAETITLKSNSSSFSLEGGELFFETFMGELRVDKGSITPLARAGAAHVDGALLLSKDATYNVHITKAQSGTYDVSVLHVAKTAKLSGECKVLPAAAFVPPASLVVLRAKDIQITADFRVNAKLPVQYSVQSGSDGQKELVLTFSKVTQESVSEEVHEFVKESISEPVKEAIREESPSVDTKEKPQGHEVVESSFEPSDEISTRPDAGGRDVSAPEESGDTPIQGGCCELGAFPESMSFWCMVCLLMGLFVSRRRVNASEHLG